MVLIYQFSSKTHHYMVLLLTIWIVKRSRYLTNAAATVPICPPNYVLFEGLCYGIENYGQRSFADSESFCANIGGNVVTLNSSQRLAAATSEVLTNKIYWLDLYDVHNLNGPNDFVWLSLNKSTGNYTNWDTDEPNVAGYRCVVIEYIGSSWKWKTRSCSSDARTLCELSTNNSSTTNSLDTTLSSESLYDSSTYEYSISSSNLVQSSLSESTSITNLALPDNISTSMFLNGILSSKEMLSNSLLLSNVLLSPTNTVQSLQLESTTILHDTILFTKETIDDSINLSSDILSPSLMTQVSWSESIYYSYEMSVSISTLIMSTTTTSVSLPDGVASTSEIYVETSASEVMTNWMASLSVKGTLTSSSGINEAVAATSVYSGISIFDSILPSNTNINATVVIPAASASNSNRDILLTIESSQKNGVAEFSVSSSQPLASSLKVAISTADSVANHPNDSTTNLTNARTLQAVSTSLSPVPESTIKQTNICSMSSISCQLLQSQNTVNSSPPSILLTNILTTSVSTQANASSIEVTYIPTTVTPYASNISVEFLDIYNQISKNQTSFTGKQAITILTNLQKALDTNGTINSDDIIIAHQALLKLNYPVNLNGTLNQTNYAKVYFSTLGILTSKHNLNAWRKTSKKDAISADILNVTDKVSKDVGHVLAVNQSFIFNSPNLDVNIVKESSSLYINYGFSMEATDTTDHNSLIQKYSLTLPPSHLATEIDNVIVSISAYKSLQYIMNKQKANSDTEGSSQASNTYLNSLILGCTVTPMPKLNNSNPFTFTLFHNKVNFTTTFQPVCVFWEFATNSKSSGNWSDSGCSVVHWNQTHTHCRCNHLTHFAILMRVTEVEISQEHLVNLDTITFICSGTSIIALFMSIVILSLVRTSSEHHEIHINLALAMLLSQIGIILTGASIIKNNNICCKILAITLHMLLLSMFSWMLAEGIHLYLKVITVFNTSSKRKLYYAIGWGSPIVTVGVAVGIGFDRYGVNKLCWLSVHSGFIWAFTGPALFVILVNFLVMILVLRVTANKSGIHPASRQFYSAKKIKSIVKATLILLPILGLTWIFGIFSMSNHTIAFSYIFVILNGLQGCFFFSFHCLYNSEVRHYLMRRVGFNSSTGSQSIALSTSNRKHPKIKISSNVEEFDVTEDQGSNSNLIYEDDDIQMTRIYPKKRNTAVERL